MNIHKNARLTPLRREEMALAAIEGRLSQARRRRNMPSASLHENGAVVRAQAEKRTRGSFEQVTLEPPREWTCSPICLLLWVSLLVI